MSTPFCRRPAVIEKARFAGNKNKYTFKLCLLIFSGSLIRRESTMPNVPKHDHETAEPTVRADEPAIGRAAMALVRSAPEFRRAALGDIRAMRRTSAGARARFLAGEADAISRHLVALHTASCDLRDVAAAYGFVLAADAAASLCALVEGAGDPHERSLNAIDGHIGVLQLIFEANLQGHGGEIGDAVLTKLSRLRAMAAPDAPAARAARGREDESLLHD